MTVPVSAYSRTLACLALHAGLLALPVLVGWQEPARAAGPGAMVTIDNFTFSPSVLTIAAGTTVTWINHDDIAHTVMEKKKSFRSGALGTDDKFSFTFSMAGDFNYFCSLHSHMTGKIVVKPGAR